MGFFLARLSGQLTPLLLASRLSTTINIVAVKPLACMLAYLPSIVATRPANEPLVTPLNTLLNTPLDKPLDKLSARPPSNNINNFPQSTVPNY